VTKITQISTNKCLVACARIQKCKANTNMCVFVKLNDLSDYEI